MCFEGVCCLTARPSSENVRGEESYYKFVRLRVVSFPPEALTGNIAWDRVEHDQKILCTVYSSTVDRQTAAGHGSEWRKIGGDEPEDSVFGQRLR
jgi:hypothetical protein